MPNYPHKLLINPQGIVNHFDGARGFEEKEDDEEEEQPEKNYTRQKVALRQAFFAYSQAIADKYVSRTLTPAFSIDYIRIDFLVTFANTIEYKTKDIFEKLYGIHPIRFYNFNKSALFEIADASKFEKLQELLVEFIDSPHSVSPEGHTYNIVTLIQGFRLLTADELFNEALGNSTGSVALQLTHQTDSVYREQKNAVQKQLLSYMQRTAAMNPDMSYKFEDRFLVINGMTVDELQDILKNFDLVASVQSLRIPRTIPGLHLPAVRTYDFTIVIGSTSLPKVVIIDTGISQATPLNPLLGAPAYTFEPMYPAYRPAHYHGTAVATIAAVGEQFFDPSNRVLNAQCLLGAYRLFEDSGGTIDLIAFEENIRDAATNGVRLFNLSVNVGAKAYNDNYSFFAYLLDKLSYELNILFFISTGNLNGDDLYAIYQRMQLPGYAAMLDYPAHFFSPDELCNEHSCEGTNLKEPAESLNNMTVGAIAENLNAATSTDMSLDKTTPASIPVNIISAPFIKSMAAALKASTLIFAFINRTLYFLVVITAQKVPAYRYWELAMLPISTARNAVPVFPLPSLQTLRPALRINTPASVSSL